MLPHHTLTTDTRRAQVLKQGPVLRSARLLTTAAASASVGTLSETASKIGVYDRAAIDARFSSRPFEVGQRMAQVLAAVARVKLAGESDGGATLRAELAALGMFGHVRRLSARSAVYIAFPKSGSTWGMSRTIFVSASWILTLVRRWEMSVCPMIIVLDFRCRGCSVEMMIHACENEDSLPTYTVIRVFGLLAAWTQNLPTYLGAFHLALSRK